MQRIRLKNENMRLVFERKLSFGFIGTIILLLFFSVVAFRAIKELESSHQWVSRTQLVLRRTNLMANELSMMEENYGDYIITGQAIHRKNYELALRSFKEKFSELHVLVKDNHIQRSHMDSLNKYAVLRLKELKNNFVYRDKNGLVASSAYIQSSSTYNRERCRETITKILQTERQLLAKRTERNSIDSNWVQSLLAICIALGISFVLILYRFIRGSFRDKQRIEENLRISEETFSTAFHSSGAGTAMVSPEGSWIDVNHALCQLLGYTKEELLDLSVQAIIHPDHLTQNAESSKKLINGDISQFSAEERYFHKNGQTIWVILNVSLVRNPDGSPKYFISQAINITESKKIAQENQQILDASIDVICSIDINGRFSHVSKACEMVWGYNADELVGRKYMDFVIDDDKEMTANITSDIVAGIAVTNFENHIVHKNGKVVPIIWSASWSEVEEIMFCIARDGSQQHELEKAIIAEKHRFEDLFLKAPSCIAIIEGSEFVFKSANYLYMDLVGKEDIIGKAFMSALPELEDQPFFTLMTQAFGMAELRSGKEMLVQLQNDESVVTNYYLDFVYQPYKDKQGKVEGIFVFANDVTEQVIARKKIEESEKRYRQLMEDMPGAVYTCDAEGRIMFYNKAAAELWGREPVIGKDLWCGSWQIFDKEGNPIPLDECPMAQTIKTGKPVRGAEIVVVKPNGEVHDIQPNPFPLFDGSGKLQGAINMLINITPHKKAEETLKMQQQALQSINLKLSEKNKAIEEATAEIEEKANELERTSRYKSEFLANMSHELRTPLNAILVLASLLGENTYDNLNAKQLEHADIIYRSGSDLLTLINDILDLAKIESGKLNIVYDHAIVSHIINDLKQLFSVMANEKNISFTVEVAENVPLIMYTDKLRLEQILKNLLSNAFKFTPKDGKIHLKISYNYDEFIIEVKDTGIGIEDDKKHVIFEAFQQANGSTTRKFGGTGLGLSISKELVKRLEGNISLESEIGKGSSFTVTLPVMECVESSPANFEITKSLDLNFGNVESNKAFTGKKLLVVDDDIRNIYAISAILDVHNIDFYTATNGIEAIEQLHAAEDISLILMDMMMPEMDGYEAMRKIRAEQCYVNLPIIALTAKAMLGDAEQCMEAGATDYITKPFVAHHLISQIKHWVTKAV